LIILAVIFKQFRFPSSAPFSPGLLPGVSPGLLPELFPFGFDTGFSGSIGSTEWIGLFTSGT
jgi:hypothetical protein